MGPAQAGIDRAKEDALREETAQTLKHAEEIGQGMIVLNAIWDQTKAIAIGATDASLIAIGSLAESNLAELGTMQAGAVQNGAGAVEDPMATGDAAALAWIAGIIQDISKSVKGD
jgi:hypothetical protein